MHILTTSLQIGTIMHQGLRCHMNYLCRSAPLPAPTCEIQIARSDKLQKYRKDTVMSIRLASNANIILLLIHHHPGHMSLRQSPGHHYRL